MELEQLGTGRHPARITELRNSSRVDAEVGEQALDVDYTVADIVGPLRRFFDRLESEAQSHRGDPVALTHALARLDALAADVRFVRDTVRTLTAEALHDARIRRLTVSSVATVEGTSSVDRTNWQHRKLMIRMLRVRFGGGFVDPATGEYVAADDLADVLLDWFTPNWKLTPIRNAGLDPDDHCDVATDEHGKATKTPAVKMVDNIVRRLR